MADHGPLPHDNSNLNVSLRGDEEHTRLCQKAQSTETGKSLVPYQLNLLPAQMGKLKVEERDDWKQMSLGAEYLLESKSRSANVHLSVFFTFQGSEPHILDAQ